MTFKNVSRPSQIVLAWSFLIILSLIWGSSFILIKRGLVTFSAVEVGTIRVTSAGIFLLPYAVFRIRQTKLKDLKYLLLVGFSGSFFPAMLFALAQTQVESSLAGVLNSTTPIFALLVGILIFSQPLKRQNLIGILIGFTGSILLIIGLNFKGINNINFYALFVILATLFYGINLNVIKFRLPDVNPLDITSLSLVLVLPFALVFLLGYSDVPYKIQDPNSWGSLAYLLILGIIGTSIALIIFNKLVKISSPLFTSTVTYFIPVVALMWGILDGEKLLVSHFAGFILILSGVFLINKKD